MLMCDYCADFFHPECVNISEEMALTIQKYQCPSCKDCKELLYEEGNNLFYISYHIIPT